jgi:prepilin-type N-terminal cleavage/methylation domain-containing protein
MDWQSFHIIFAMKGFTLIEVLIVASITVLITGFLVVNFSRLRTDLNQTTLTVQDAIREAQSNALSGELIRGTYRCGYGVHFDAKGYVLYAGPDSSTVSCATQNKNYEPGTDAIVRSALLQNNVLEIVLPAPDIFFEPPGPTTYINNVSTAGTNATILIRTPNAACPSSDCRNIYVNTSGRIQ